MKAHLAGVVLILVLLMTGCFHSNGSTGDQEGKAQVERFIEAIKAEDVEQLSSVVAPAVTIEDGINGSSQGYSKQQFQDVFATEFGRHDSFRTITYTITNTVRSGNNLLVDVQLSMVTNGEQSNQEWSFYLVDSNGAWMIAKWTIRSYSSSGDGGGDSGTGGQVKTITLTGRLVNESGEPVQATVSAWQVTSRNSSASARNPWDIPEWVMPQARTESDGTFTLVLKDYAELETHQYWLFIAPDDPRYKYPTGQYVSMENYSDGQAVDWGTIVVLEDKAS